VKVRRSSVTRMFGFSSWSWEAHRGCRNIFTYLLTYFHSAMASATGH